MKTFVRVVTVLALGAAAFYFVFNVDHHLLSSPARAAQPAAALREVARFDLPGPKGKRFDYLTIDYDDNYLLSAHLGAGLLYVIDLKTNKLVATVSPVPGVEGVEYVPELKKAYTSDWYENKIGVVDLKTMKVMGRLPAGDKPDGSTMLHISRSSMSPTSAAKLRLWLMSPETRSSRQCISTVRQECRNTIP